MELKDYFTANLRGITAQEGLALSFVGLNIVQNKDHIPVNRRGYIEKPIAKEDPKDISSSATLYPLHLNELESLSNTVSLPENALTSAIMELNYLDDVRPDIKFAAAFLTQNMSKPTVPLARHVKQLFNYLASTKDTFLHECGLQWIILIERRFFCEKVLVLLVLGIIEDYLI